MEPAEAREPFMIGFGWSFYGFFIAAAIWMALYFVWAFLVDDAKDQRPR